MARDGITLRLELVVFAGESSSFHIVRIVHILANQVVGTFSNEAANIEGGHSRFGFPNLMDATLFRSLALTFIVCFVALAAIFNIFTLFELWRFIATTQPGAGLVARYLLFLLPLVTVELFPATMLISVLVTYALLARRHEAIAWWASGQCLPLDAARFLFRHRDCFWFVAGAGVRDAELI